VFAQASVVVAVEATRSVVARTTAVTMAMGMKEKTVCLL
jgi:hypothetical protein